MNNEDVRSVGAIEKTPSGIGGFDHIAQGGIPSGGSTLVSGTSGSGKTVLGVQFLMAGIRTLDQPGVIVTFEETPAKLTLHMSGFGWDLDDLIERGKLAFVDATPEPGDDLLVAGSYDFSALMARIEYAVRSIDARRVILDSLGAVFPQFSDAGVVRRELHRIAHGLAGLGVTTLITMERGEEYGEIARFGVEEFVADNVIILRNPLDRERRRRTVEILKFRGTNHHKGEFPFTIDPRNGITVIPLSAIELKQKSSNIRISSGNSDVDTMCGGGIFRDSVILVSGATGTGKTLMVTKLVDATISRGDRALMFAYEESREQLIRNATSWGVDLPGAEEAGLPRIVCRYPETLGLEDHLIQIKEQLEDFKPAIIAVDSLSALERVTSFKPFREFVIGLTSHVKHLEMAGMFTNTTSMLMGGESVTESHISTIADSIVLLRYVELQGEMRRGIAVLKMRGSWHDKSIREYIVTEKGMDVRESFRDVSGILSGSPVYIIGEERERLVEMFDAGGRGTL